MACDRIPLMREREVIEIERERGVIEIERERGFLPCFLYLRINALKSC